MSTNFINSFTRGFTEVGEPKVAVCLMPGTELAFEQDIEVEHVFRKMLPRFGFGRTGQRVARFRQVNIDRPDTHHDALEFPDGRVVLVTRLCAGQRATVLQLPATATTTAKVAQGRDERPTPVVPSRPTTTSPIG